MLAFDKKGTFHNPQKGEETASLLPYRIFVTNKGVFFFPIHYYLLLLDG